MPKSKPEVLRALRAELQEIASSCEWPGCENQGEQMAHLLHRQMGGSELANTLENVAWLCVDHHDQFDGRRHLNRYELRVLLGAYLAHERKSRGFTLTNE